VNYSQNARIRQITLSSFHIDDTEISNNEYRQFVDEVVAGSENAFMDSVFSFMERYYGKKNKQSAKNTKRYRLPGGGCTRSGGVRAVAAMDAGARGLRRQGSGRL
jgi:formylglycine-generating enzyme required for sulfatase activity